MIDARAKYEQAFAAFATPGGRWANKGALTYWGKAAGLSADDLIADARAAGVTDRDADIRRGWEDARPKGAIAARPDCARFGKHGKREAQPPRFAAHVRNLLAGLDADKGAPDWVRELSPCLDWLGQPPEAQTAAFIRAAFRPDELLFIRKAKQGTVAAPGVNIRTAADWLNLIEHGKSIGGECVTVNPLTGKEGKTRNGKPSFRSHDCFADFPFALIEFDAMPLPMQYAFWRGFILTHKLAPALVSVAFSGNKSLHGLLNVGCSTLLEWQAVRNRLIGLFAADDDARFRIDTEALAIDKAVRLPGIVRPDTHKAQELLYLNPAARSGNGWIATDPAPVDFAKPPCGAAHGKGLCGACSSFGRCPFADPDAVRGTTLKGGVR